MYVCAYIAMDVISAVALYYCENILAGMEIFGLDMGNNSIVVIGPFMVCAALAVPLAYYNMRKRSKQFAYRFTIPGFIATVIIMVSVQPNWSPWIVIIDMVLMGFFFGGSQVMPWLIFPDTVDVVELKKGDRPSGSMGAVMTFCRTITTAVASASVGWVLAGAHYIEHTADQVVTQPESVATALRIFIGVAVGLLFVCAFVASCSYKVTDKKLARIRYFNDKARAGENNTLTIAEQVEKDMLITELCGK
jgi:GPH family glycoside/pentoside/hexuronide:cation symporter/oligogalacturonide transporter